jgi:hypothetical protein
MPPTPKGLVCFLCDFEFKFKLVTAKPKQQSQNDKKSQEGRGETICLYEPIY